MKHFIAALLVLTSQAALPAEPARLSWPAPPQIVMTRSNDVFRRVERYDKEFSHQSERANSPAALVRTYFKLGRIDQMEAFFADVAETGERDGQGRFVVDVSAERLFRVIESTLDEPGKPKLPDFAGWRVARPDSPAGPILEAIQLNATAWHRRGGGSANEVQSLRMREFQRRSKAAWDLLMAKREQSASIPTWYQFAIYTGTDAGIPMAELRRLADEGIARFPGNHGILFAYVRKLSPLWGGSFAAADEFIRKQSDSSGNPEGDALYSRLYEEFSEHIGGADLFKDSRVSWPRMRSGFERMIDMFPDDGDWNTSKLGLFSCWARDAASFRRQQQSINPDVYDELGPPDITPIDCYEWANNIKR
jgi:hypothetical protein